MTNPTEPLRKKPRQQRSQMMVDAIIDSGFISLMRNGLEGTTTRHVAEIAGISVGSLYQYFPDKEAIYAAMHQQFVSEVIVFLREVAPELVQRELRPGVTLLLERVREFLEQGDGRYLFYVRYALQLDIDGAEVDRLEAVLMEICMQYIMAHPKLMQIPNISGGLWFLINGGVFAVLRFMSRPQPKISFEQLVDSISTILERMAGDQSVKPTDGQHGSSS